MPRQIQCHKCQYDGLGSAECLKCVGSKDLRLSNKFVHLSDDFQVRAKKQTTPRNVTRLMGDAEDVLRMFLCELFDLPPLQILMMIHLMHDGQLTTFGSFTANVHSLTRQRMTRQRAHQIKEALLKSLKSTLAAPLVERGDR